jgi:hypothetical protein
MTLILKPNSPPNNTPGGSAVLESAGFGARVWADGHAKAVAGRPELSAWLRPNTRTCMYLLPPRLLHTSFNYNKTNPKLDNFKLGLRGADLA